MARKKVDSKVTHEAGTNGISKGQAVKDGLAHLGMDAKNEELEGWIRSTYGETAVPSNMSVAKSNAKAALRKAGESALVEQPRATKAAALTESKVTGQAGHGKTPALAALRQLVGLVGRDAAKTLIDQI